MNAKDLKEKIKKQLHSAIKDFGEYSFFDKGPDEVMDINSIITELKDLPLIEIGGIFSEILNEEKKYGKNLVDCLVGCLDDREDFDDLFEMDDRFEY